MPKKNGGKFMIEFEFSLINRFNVIFDDLEINNSDIVLNGPDNRRHFLPFQTSLIDR